MAVGLAGICRLTKTRTDEWKQEALDQLKIFGPYVSYPLIVFASAFSFFIQNISHISYGVIRAVSL